MINSGDKFGKWSVLDKRTKNEKGEKMWLCQCECGTRRYVLERSLKYGNSKSCGCVTRQRAQEAKSYDLSGKVFGELTVLYRTDVRSNSGRKWKCQCSCGNTCEVLATHLVTGKRTTCGCKSRRGKHTKDITGQQFYRLKALYPLEERGTNGSAIWRCRCDCGKEVDISSNELLYSNTRSCGCKKKEHDEKLKSYLTHIDGTSIDILKSKKIPRDNTTGIKGVYFIRGKYIAKIVFQKKAYYLGTYDNITDAAEARKEAEELLYDGTTAFYELWKEKADEDESWAKNNPIEIKVKKDVTNGLSITFLPIL